MTAGSRGNDFAGTSRSDPGSIAAQRGGSSGSLGKLTVVRTPRSSRKFASPSIEPRASASGFT